MHSAHAYLFLCSLSSLAPADMQEGIHYSITEAERRMLEPLILLTHPGDRPTNRIVEYPFSKSCPLVSDDQFVAVYNEGTPEFGEVADVFNKIEWGTQVGDPLPTKRQPMWRSMRLEAI